MHKYKINQWIFVVLIPLFMLFIAFIFDFALMFTQDIRVDLTTKKIMKDSLTYPKSDYYTNIKESFKKQKIETELLVVDYDEGYLTVYNSHSYTSFFGRLIGVNNYRSDVHLTGHKEGKKIILEEVHDE